MNQFAPIALFAFTRPAHTRKTLDALSANLYADKTNLIVYLDAADSNKEEEACSEVLNIISNESRFQHVEIIRRKSNFGLARNIIDGVTEVSEYYGKVIVVEDDIITGPYFIDFMNRSLSKYEKNLNVWHISGWNYPFDNKGLSDAFFWGLMNCWGWATWENRWRNFNKDPCYLISSWNEDKIRNFNMGNTYNFWNQVIENSSGTLNTWAIFWYATIFENNGLCLNPTRSLVKNIGLDGSGHNCGKNEGFDFDPSESQLINLPDKILISEVAVKKFRKFNENLQPSIRKELVYTIKNIFNM